jgi:hypothetical protein
MRSRCFRGALIGALWTGPVHGSDGNCPVYSVVPTDNGIAVDFDGARLPRASLVRSGCGVICPDDHTPVQVMSVNHWYQEPDQSLAVVGAVGCMRTALIQPVEGMRLLGLDPPPGGDATDLLAPGTVTEPVGPATPCSDSRITLGEAGVSTRSLRHARPVTAPQLAAMRAVQADYVAAFAPIDLHRIGLSDFGYVGLPIVHERTAAEIQAAWTREGLDTDKRREKAVVAEGPAAEDGTPIYLHFLGTDARFSDRWARPSTIGAVLRLAANWYAYCSDRLRRNGQAPTAAACTLQIGDLAWYNDRQPDPLGHRHHHEGRCVDIRLFRADGSRYEAYWNKPDDRDGFPKGYSPGLTGQFIHYAVRNAPVSTIYFNDPDLHVKFKEVEPRPGHDDHIHMCFE